MTGYRCASPQGLGWVVKSSWSPFHPQHSARTSETGYKSETWGEGQRGFIEGEEKLMKTEWQQEKS